jgi:RHS repeat-associated protein
MPQLTNPSLSPFSRCSPSPREQQLKKKSHLGSARFFNACARRSRAAKWKYASGLEGMFVRRRQRGRQQKKTVGSETTYYFYGPGGLLCEFSTSNALSSATAASSMDRTLYRTSDKLGSAVLVINAFGLVIENNRTLPYGEAWLAESTPSTNDKKFTTYQRDSESGLDYAMARYFGSMTGRFLSPDSGSYSLEFPQSLNRYVYVQNDPVNHLDSDGRECSKVTVIIDGKRYVYERCTSGPPPVPPYGQRGSGSGRGMLASGTSALQQELKSRQRESDMQDIVSRRVHALLDMAGLTPGAGEVADLINALIYGLEGNWADAGISIAAMAPFAGAGSSGSRILRRLLLEGLPEGAGVGKHAHHLLPQEFRQKFEALGINIDTKDLGVLLDISDHRNLHNVMGYNKRWDQFFANNPKATADDVMRFLENLRGEFGY